jgi:hypothetical protein
MWKKLTDKKALKLITKIEEPFKQLPHLPQSLIDFFVKIAPWGVGLGAFFSLTGAINSFQFAFGMGTLSRVMHYYAGINSSYFIIMGILQLALTVLAVKAFNPLKEKKLKGWVYLFWSNTVAIIEFVVGMIFIGGSGFGMALFILMGFYLLFELKPAYEQKAESTKKKAVKK